MVLKRPPELILKSCLDCGKEMWIRKAGKPKKRCPECAEVERLRYAREYKRALRDRVLHHYSNGTMECACCGESHNEFLTIHHINGNGADHRREIAKLRNLRNQRTDKPARTSLNSVGNEINMWLTKNNFPDGFAVLCSNCNAAKHYYGECPHEKEKKF